MREKGAQLESWSTSTLHTDSTVEKFSGDASATLHTVQDDTVLSSSYHHFVSQASKEKDIAALPMLQNSKATNSTSNYPYMR